MDSKMDVEIVNRINMNFLVMYHFYRNDLL